MPNRDLTADDLMSAVRVRAIASDDLMQINDQNVFGPRSAELHGVHAGDAEKRLPHHVIDVDFYCAVAAERRGMHRKPFTARMVIGLAADAVALSRKNTAKRFFKRGPLREHLLPIKFADVVEVDIDRQPVEAEMKHVERRAAFEREAAREKVVARNVLQKINEAQDLLQCARLVAGV